MTRQPSEGQPLSQNEPALYVATAAIGWRVFAAAAAVGFVWLLGQRDSTTGEFVVVDAWSRWGWIGKGALLLVSAAVPRFLLECFVARTIFQQNHVAVRNTLGQWRRYRYSDVQRVDRVARGIVEVGFRDGWTLTLRRWNTDLERATSILQGHGNSGQRRSGGESDDR